jgi:glycosyltransferase involved in cell wall biosynthesis
MYGAEGVILNLAVRLRARNIDNTIVCIRNPKRPHLELMDKARQQGLDGNFIDCNGLFDPSAVHALRRMLIEEGFDIIHCHDYKSNFMGLLAAAGLKIKRVTTNHLWTSDTLALRFYEFIDSLLINFYHRIIAVSERIEAEVGAVCFNKKNIVLIHNGIDTESFRPSRDHDPQLRAGFGFGEKDIVIGMIGRLTPQKGHSHMLEAMRDIPDAKLLIAGSGPLEEELKELARRLYVDDRVVFAGVRRDILAIYNMIDIFAMPSLDEGLPLALLEAMACEKPVVVSSVGAVPSVIVHLYNGLMPAPGNSKQLAGMINSLIKDPDLARNISKQARDTVVNSFSAEVMGDRYIDVYNMLKAHS